MFFTEHHSENVFEVNVDDQNVEMDCSNDDVLTFRPNTNALADHVRQAERPMEAIGDLPPQRPSFRFLLGADEEESTAEEKCRLTVDRSHRLESQILQNW